MLDHSFGLFFTFYLPFSLLFPFLGPSPFLGSYTYLILRFKHILFWITFSSYLPSYFYILPLPDFLSSRCLSPTSGPYRSLLALLISLLSYSPLDVDFFFPLLPAAPSHCGSSGKALAFSIVTLFRLFSSFLLTLSVRTVDWCVFFRNSLQWPSFSVFLFLFTPPFSFFWRLGTITLHPAFSLFFAYSGLLSSYWII